MTPENCDAYDWINRNTEECEDGSVITCLVCGALTRQRFIHAQWHLKTDKGGWEP